MMLEKGRVNSTRLLLNKGRFLGWSKQSTIMNKVLIKILFSILIFLQIPNAHSHNDNNLDSLCTFSNIPLINKIGCRKVTTEEINSLKNTGLMKQTKTYAIIFIFLLQTHMQPNNFYWIIT